MNYPIEVEMERGTPQWWCEFYKQNINGIDDPGKFPSIPKFTDGKL
jgi:hypothetical protein